jgi:hypothetical protein
MSARRAIAGAVVIAMTLTTPASAADEWRWLCSSSGGYFMTVLPDGSYKPEADFSDRNRAIEVTVRQLNMEGSKAKCGTIWALYAVEIKGNELASDWQDACSQQVEVSREAAKSVPGAVVQPIFGNIRRVEAVSYFSTSKTLLLHRADTDWRFVISSSDLTTDKDARELNGSNYIDRHPWKQDRSWTLTFDAKASAWLMTGTCKLVVGR